MLLQVAAQDAALSLAVASQSAWLHIRTAKSATTFTSKVPSIAVTRGSIMLLQHAAHLAEAQ